MLRAFLKESSPEYSLEGLMLKLKLQYFGHLMRRADSLEKTLMLGQTEGKRYNVMILWILFTSSVVLTCLDSSLLQEEGGTALLLPGGSRNPSPRLAFVDT